MSSLPPCPACASSLTYQDGALFICPECSHEWSTVVKVGTKVKSIRLVAGDHDIDCRIEGIGAMGLKSEFVKKI